MIPQPYVRFDPPVTLCLTLPSASRPRTEPFSDGRDTWQEFEALPMIPHYDGLAMTITVNLPPIAKEILLYGPEDFKAACADDLEDYVAQVLRILGSDPAATLQALIDGGELPAPPPRVPREVAHWRIVHILSKMGKLAMVEAMIADLPPEDRAVAMDAWEGKAALNIKSPLVLAACQWLGFTMADRDALFIAAAAIPA